MADADFSESVRAHTAAVDAFFAAHTADLIRLSEVIQECLSRPDGKLLLCGNGGSACDSMHIAGEFVGRFKRERGALPAISLAADSGILTAVGNDYGFEQVFARQVAAYGRKGDVLIALSTSGQSANVLQALRAAREQGLFTVLFTGEKGHNRTADVDVLLVVPSSSTARIQEAHMLALHLIAERVEEALLSIPPRHP